MSLEAFVYCPYPHLVLKLPIRVCGFCIFTASCFAYPQNPDLGREHSSQYSVIQKSATKQKRRWVVLPSYHTSTSPSLPWFMTLDPSVFFLSWVLQSCPLELVQKEPLLLQPLFLEFGTHLAPPYSNPHTCLPHHSCFYTSS
jgi:hypothetical protein